MKDVVFHDYANWILEISDLTEALKEKKSILLDRFKYVLDVLDFLYDKKINEKTLNNEEESIFETGFYYVFEQFENIKLILEHDYQGDIDLMDIQSKTVILLLNTIEFQNEIIGNSDEANEAHMQLLVDIEQEVLGLLEKKTDAPIDLFEKLDTVTEGIYKDLELDYYPIHDIFFEIADEFGLIL